MRTLDVVLAVLLGVLLVLLGFALAFAAFAPSALAQVVAHLIRL